MRAASTLLREPMPSAERPPELEDLARRAGGGDEEAFGALYDALAPGTLRFLRGLRLGLGPEQLEDALQESFLRLLRRLPSLERPARVGSYLLGIAHHVAVDLARGGKSVEELHEAVAPDDPAGRAADGERDRLVSAALEALPVEARAALALRHVAGLTMDDLADALGCSVPTARARLSEAASRLALELRRRGVEPTGAGGRA
jgi:RNA polymerase sigma-70 factor (ECF subfamily)